MGTQRVRRDFHHAVGMEIIWQSAVDAVSRPVDSIYGSYLRVANVASRYDLAVDVIWAVEENLSLALDHILVVADAVT